MVTVRPLAPSDRDRLARGFERLSPDSRYRRFFAPINRLSERQLDYLTQVDQHDHVALVAVEGDELVGVARFVRTGPATAEPAIVVADDWQHHGVGSRLLDRLVERAREEGVQRFVAPILASNAAAIRSFERLGDTAIARHGPEVELTIELPERAPSDGMHRLLQSVAAGVVEPALVFWHRLLPRRGRPREELADVIVTATDAAALEVAREVAAATGAALVEVAPGWGDLGARLLDAAIDQRARLIVVADAGGDEGVAGRLLGSAWDHVSHHAPCDVLIARR